MAVNAGAIDVKPGIARGQLLHRADLIGQGVVAHVAVVGLVKFLRAPRRPHPVDLDDDEPELRQRLRIAARRRELAAADAAGLRTRINMVDDRISLRRVQIHRFVHQPVQIGDPVARLHCERHRRLPAGGKQPGDVGFFKGQHRPAVRILENRRRRHIGRRKDVDDIAARA